MLCQTTQAISFYEQNFAEVRFCESALKEKAREFLNKIASPLLSPAEIARLEKTLGEDLGCFANHLRGYATKFVVARQSWSFWDLVDACSSFSDAVGSFWSYMTLDVRAARLQHAREHLEDLKHGLNAIAVAG